MASGQLDITIDKGATFNKTLFWKDSTKIAINITGYTARMQIRESLNATNFLKELTTENGGINIVGAEGKIELFISDADTSALAGTKAVYDLELITNDDPAQVIKFIRGTISLVDEVTR